MNNKDFYKLMGFPVFCLVLLAALALFVSNLYSKLSNRHDNEIQSSRQKFEGFVENVKNGKWQLTTDQWIEGMRLQRSAVEEQRNIAVSLTRLIRTIGWFSLILAACVALVALNVRDGIKKHESANSKITN